MDVGPGSYWDAPTDGAPARFRVERIIPSDDGPFIYARDLVTRSGVVVRFDVWTARFVRLTLTGAGA